VKTPFVGSVDANSRLDYCAIDRARGGSRSLNDRLRQSPDCKVLYQTCHFPSLDRRARRSIDQLLSTVQGYYPAQLLESAERGVPARNAEDFMLIDVA
jgi:hypothetical protein